jgi:hypothetical protein
MMTRLFRTVRTIDPAAESKAEEASNRIQARGYRLPAVITLPQDDAVSSLVAEAQRIVRQASASASIDIIDGKRVLRLLSDYLDGVAPPVPLLELEMESGRGITLDGILQRFDGDTGIESWVFRSMSNISRTCTSNAVFVLFARNVRGFLGETAINKNMEKTLQQAPEFFWVLQ